MMVRIFRHYVPTPLLVLASVETVMLFASIYVGAYLRYPDRFFIMLTDFGPLFPKAFIFTITMLGIMAALGLYEREIKEGDWGYYSRFMAAFPIGFIAMTFIFYAVPSLFLWRSILTISFMVALVGTATLRFIFLSVVDSEVIKRRVLVVGAGSRSMRVAALKKSDGRRRFHLVGYLPVDTVHPTLDKNLVINHKLPILAICEKYNVDEIVIGVRQRRGGTLPMGELLECRMEGIDVVDMSTFFERETGKVQLESLNPSWIVFSEGFDRGNIRNVIKRMFDITASSILLLLTLPIMILTVILIKIDSRGPIFYKQARIGECGNPFGVIKFRSMRADAEVDGKPRWAKKNDHRITRVGRIIRAFRIDELPQVINVLRGDMSFVGPRPERPFFVKQLAKEIPFFLMRHSVRPGITGWAQIRYPYGASVEDAKEKLQYDLYYAKNHTLFLDLIILFQTAQVVVFSKGAR